MIKGTAAFFLWRTRKHQFENSSLNGKNESGGVLGADTVLRRLLAVIGTNFSSACEPSAVAGGIGEWTEQY